MDEMRKSAAYDAGKLSPNDFMAKLRHTVPARPIDCFFRHFHKNLVIATYRNGF